MSRFLFCLNVSLSILSAGALGDFLLPHTGDDSLRFFMHGGRKAKGSECLQFIIILLQIRRCRPLQESPPSSHTCCEITLRALTFPAQTQFYHPLSLPSKLFHVHASVGANALTLDRHNCPRNLLNKVLPSPDMSS